jgi:hypothetical protein
MDWYPMSDYGFATVIEPLRLAALLIRKQRTATVVSGFCYYLIFNIIKDHG